MKANQNIAKALTTIDNLNLKGENLPLLIMSHPGFGKTSTIAMYCKYKDYNLYTLIASQYSADDILGLQTLKGDRLIRLTPAWFDEMRALASNGKRTLLFLDEITCVDEWIQGPLLDLIFNRRLGTQNLPENVFIVAAGNYSKDLNNTFKMSSPLVNRFLILNVWNDDFNVKEYLKDNFNKISSPQEIEAYLGIKPQAPYFSYKNFREWAYNSNEIDFGRSFYSEDDTFGLLGFTSIRSLDYSLKFIEEYFSLFGKDTLWARVVGDTLGMSSSREGKSMRAILLANIRKFKDPTNVQEESLSFKCQVILNKGKITELDSMEISHLLEDMPAEELTPFEINKLSSLIKLTFSDEKLKPLADQILAKTSQIQAI